MSDAARDRFHQRLATVGCDPADLVVDDKGTMVDLRSRSSHAPPAALDEGAVRLPLLELDAVPGHLPDVKILGLLGEGGMGRVHAAEQVALRREVAVKQLRTDAGPVDTTELLREAIITGRLAHPSIVPVYLLGRMRNGMPLLVMKRIEGVGWLEVLRDPSKAPSGADTSDLLGYHLEVFLKVCDAVHFAHSRRILHRDLKPENVMLGAFGEVYVVDWGIAVSLDEASGLPLARDIRSISGTPAYMAPEMAGIDVPQISERTDVYLLGAILHELLSGRPPHKGNSVVEQLVAAFEAKVPEYGPEVPQELADICKRALAPKPAGRYASVDELRRAVQAFRRHQSSWALAQEADRRVRELSQLLQPGAAAVDERELRALFAECRFGYRQALAAWEGNASARAGLRRALLLMVRFELDAKNPRSAHALLGQLDDPPQELVQAAQSLLAEERQRQQRLADLESLHRDLDVTQASNARSNAMAGLTVFWFLVSVLAAQLDARGILRFGYREAMAAIVTNAVLVASLSAGIAWRIKVNAVQRRVLLIASLAGVGFTNHWWFSWWMNVPLNYALVTFLLWVAGGWIILAIFFDRRMTWTGLAFGAGGFAAGLLPRYQIYAFAFSVLFGYGAIAWIWRERRAAPALARK